MCLAILVAMMICLAIVILSCEKQNIPTYIHTYICIHTYIHDIHTSYIRYIHTYIHESFSERVI